MSVLATFVGGWGHAEPLLELARLARTLGHRMTFTGQAAILPRPEALGYSTAEASGSPTSYVVCVGGRVATRAIAAPLKSSAVPAAEYVRSCPPCVAAHCSPQAMIAAI